MNPNCICPVAGYCQRHQMFKTQRQFDLCRGATNTTDCGRKYWLAWEQGKAGATKPENPILDPPPFCDQVRGFGDRVSRVISTATGGALSTRKCGGCGDRAAKLNHWFPNAVLPPIESVEFVEPVRRNFMMHIWPVAGFGAWQWNVEQVLKRAELFNGRRVVAIATSKETDSADAVKEMFRDFTDEFIVVPNNKSLREVITFVPLLERFESANPNEVTFCCHGKCVRHNIGVEESGSTIFRWTQAMYETCLDYMPLVMEQLRTKAMTGSFKRHGMFKTRGNYRWHYSGTFYWFRNADVYRRNWRYIDKKFFGSESWPGLMFKPDETDCLFLDQTQDLYNFDYWTSVVQPALDQWKQSHSLVESQYANHSV